MRIRAPITVPQTLSFPKQMQFRHLKYDPWQIEFLNTKGDKILCCGRQVGKSEICAKDAGDYAIKPDNPHPVVMIAPTERQAYGLFTKTLNYLAHTYPNQVVIKGKDRPTKTRIKLKNGMEIYCLPVGKDGLGVRFLTIGRLYKDECSRIPEAVHEAVDPALLTTGGDEIMLSTPAGALGTFYDVWVNKENAYNSFTRFSITSEKVIEEREICGTWTEHIREKALNKLRQAKKRWTKRRYAQEYLGEFMSDLHRWFSDELIENCCILQRPEQKSSGDYYMGVDIARMGEDEGTIEIIKRINDTTFIHVENIVTRKQLTTQTEDNILQAHDQFNEIVKIGIDAGAGTLGVSVLDHLLEVTRVKRKVMAIDNAKRITDRDGHEKKLLKVDLYDNLKAMMERGEIKFLADDDLIASFRSVQYEYILKDDEPTRLKIFGNYTHIVEGLIRAAWLAKKEKSKNINILSI